ncbi:MAG: nucleotidyl transferase AbiEii/AbiGii toxin family protein [Ferroplasma sp.]|uniref:nucleotidyl transferase AbiEii/AbiGii toxin family protein n=1 Tax=Ferroplasma sp. TaxID=2591003 RepID=UPI00281695B4|nr:nucleotidyl transferase AbiEii/AbiGii toxin family protein [Ferroplasma sp.]WMT50783.1 MAG: nucleotidyl transferase AbiEii/AbiGii toxin family protein [Ferroplasma sp.]
MKLPIIRQLKNRNQVEVAKLQDELIIILYNTDNSMVIHGGTSLWRCYSGNRFSEDIDLYSLSFPNYLDEFKNEIKSHELKLLKLKDTGNILFSNISDGNVNVKIEINHKYYPENPVEREYELTDGNSVNVLTLSPEDLIKEKILAYIDRRYIRDLYDIYILIKYIQHPEYITENLVSFINNMQKPVDEDVLKSIVYIGLAPSYSRMLDYIKQYINSFK